MNIITIKHIIISIIDIVSSLVIAYAIYKGFRADVKMTPVLKEKMQKWNPEKNRSRYKVSIFLGIILVVLGIFLVGYMGFTFFVSIIFTAALFCFGISFHLHRLLIIHKTQGVDGLVKAMLLLNKSMFAMIAVIVLTNFISRDRNPFVMISIGIVAVIFLAIPPYLVAKEKHLEELH